jgi:ATP-dependent RNA helicase DDX10/DBP4
MKSIYLQKDKTIFDLTALPIEAFAASLGLPGAPQIKFIGQAHAKKNAARGKSQGEKVETNMAGEKEVPTVATLEVAAAESESDESEIGSDGDESGVEVEFGDAAAIEEDDSESEEQASEVADDAVVKKVS